MIFKVFAYAPGCGASGLTRAETVPQAGRTVAADWSVLPRGTPVLIHGIGPRVVEDTGRAIRGRTLDVFVGTCGEAPAMTGKREVTVLPREVSQAEYDELQAAVLEARQTTTMVKVLPVSVVPIERRSEHLIVAGCLVLILLLAVWTTAWTAAQIVLPRRRVR
jgi:3D (Asp-Asp-Asp) domain-containing protein